MSNAQLRSRIDGLLWQEAVRGREAVALAAIAQPGIADDQIIDVIRVAIPNPVRDEASYSLASRITALAWHKASDGREALALLLIQKTGLSIESAIATLRAAPQDACGQPEATETAAEIMGRRIAEAGRRLRQ